MTALDGRQVLFRGAEGGVAFLPTAGLRPGIHVLGIRRGAEVHRIKVAMTGG